MAFFLATREVEMVGVNSMLYGDTSNVVMVTHPNVVMVTHPNVVMVTHPNVIMITCCPIVPTE